jgi:hypothetical protein
MGLHARKKHSSSGGDDGVLSSDVDVEIAGAARAPVSGGSTDRIHPRGGGGSPICGSYFRMRQFIRSEAGLAIESIVAFLVFGLVLCWVMLHHHHRKVRTREEEEILLFGLLN